MEDRLITAVDEGDLREVKYLLDQGIDQKKYRNNIQHIKLH